MHYKDHAQYDLCDVGVYSMCMLVGQVSELVESFNIGIFSDIINVINIEFRMVVLLIGLDLLIPLSVTVTILQGHKQCRIILIENFVLI